MPIVDIEIVGDDGKLPDGLAGALAEAMGEVFAAPAGRVWVKLRGLASACYAENGGGPEAGVQPVFVNVLLAKYPGHSDWQRTASRIAEAVGRCCDRPTENVHVLLEPEGQGRIAFGGRLLG